MSYNYDVEIIQQVRRSAFEDGQKVALRKVFSTIDKLLEFEIQGDPRRTEHALALHWVQKKIREEFDK